jgi:hypothetical protein
MPRTPSSAHATITALLLLATLLFACGPEDGDEGEASAGFDRDSMTIVTAGGESVDLQVEIAETREQRTQGLMGRRELAPDSGMLFLIEPPGRGFWMRGTMLSLTVAFISACGELVDFADLEPLSEEIKNTDRPYAFALEMQRGWFADHGIAPGAVIQLPERLLASNCPN